MFGGLATAIFKTLVTADYSVMLVFVCMSVFVVSVLGSIQELFNPEKFEVTRDAQIIRFSWMLFAIIVCMIGVVI